MKEETTMKNKLRTLVALLLTACLLTAAGTVFAEGGATTISGVHDQSVMAGTEFDALDGVTATDANAGVQKRNRDSREPRQL